MSRCCGASPTISVMDGDGSQQSSRLHIQDGQCINVYVNIYIYLHMYLYMYMYIIDVTNQLVNAFPATHIYALLRTFTRAMNICIHGWMNT